MRYADDLVVGFEHEGDARRFLDAMRDRLGEFALSLHPDKTRLIKFGRFAATDRELGGLGKSRISERPHVTETGKLACHGFRGMGAEKAGGTAGCRVRLTGGAIGAAERGRRSPAATSSSLWPVRL